jgi:hypothetical protein
MRINPGVLYVAPGGDDANTCITFTAPCRTIQAAVDSATTGDTIRVASGVYTNVSACAGITQVVYISKSVTIQGGYTATNWATPYPITQPATLDAQGKGRVVYITGNISPTVEGLRITGGNASELGGHTDQWGYVNSAGGGMYIITAAATIRDNQIFGNRYAAYGGGVYILAAPVDIRHNRICSNTAMLGNGVYVKNSNVTISNNAITANTIGAGGSGLYLEFSSATLNDNTITDNSADRGGGVLLEHSNATLNGNFIANNSAFCWMPRFCDVRGGSGGGLYLDNSAAMLNHNTILSNTAGNGFCQGLGGGLYLENSDATLNRNIVSGNTARNGSYDTGLGGGLYLEHSDVTFDGNTVAANVAGAGGGIYVDHSNATMVNDLIADNRVNEEGGGLYFESASPRLWHTTIARNGGSGIYVTSYSDGQIITHSAVLLTNTVLVSHSVGINVTAGNTATLNATLWGSGDWANRSDWGGKGIVITGTHNYWGNPAFVAPDVGDYHIGSDSAARDAGIDTSVNSDIDGDPRPMGHSYDIGADEFPVSLRLVKHAIPNPVQTGASLTWILRVTNTGGVNLHATITDSLPTRITTGTTSGGTLFLPGETITWTPVITAPGGVWTQQVVVTVEMGHVGPLPNVVQVTTVEGASGAYTETATVVKPYAYLPLILRQFP